MSTRDIRGMAIICRPEHEDSNGYLRCGNCKSKLLLVAAISEWAVDEETFKNGEPTPPEIPDCVFVGELSGHWCPKCEMLTSLNYSFT